MNAEPSKRIRWGSKHVSEDRSDLAKWEDGEITDKMLIDSLRQRHYLVIAPTRLSSETWTDAEIMENVYWLGYDKERAKDESQNW